MHKLITALDTENHELCGNNVGSIAVLEIHYR